MCVFVFVLCNLLGPTWVRNFFSSASRPFDWMFWFLSVFEKLEFYIGICSERDFGSKNWCFAEKSWRDVPERDFGYFYWYFSWCQIFAFSVDHSPRSQARQHSLWSPWPCKNRWFWNFKNLWDVSSIFTIFFFFLLSFKWKFQIEQQWFRRTRNDKNWHSILYGTGNP